MRIEKLPSSSSVRVWVDGKCVGLVKRVERWVVRGKRIEWEAYRTGRYQGSFATRLAAAQSLANR